LAPPFASAIAPSFGMFILNRYSSTLLFLACTGFSLCALFFSCTLKGRGTVGPGKSAATRNPPFFERRIVAPAIVNFFIHFINGALLAFFPLYAIQCEVTNPGHFFSAFAAMIIVGRIFGGRILDTYSKEKVILTAICVATAAMVMLSFSRTLSLFIIVGLLWGIGAAFLSPATLAYAFDYSGSSGGTAIGTYQVFMDLGAALGPMVMGVIIPFTGYPVMFLCLALMCLINLAYFQFYVRARGPLVSRG
jgi:MFS family permease